MRASNNRLLILISLLLVGVVALIIVVSLRFGSSYKNAIADIGKETEQKQQEIVSSEANTIQSIVIREQGSNAQCIEVTNSGIIRVDETCDGEADRATRVIDPSRIIRLLRKIEERPKLSRLTRASGRVIELVVTLVDGSKETVYISDDEEINDEVIEIIDVIKGDAPTPIPTIPPITATQAPTWYVPPPSATPTVYVYPGVPTATPAIPDVPFSCGYEDGKKPTNVSNTMCTTGPTPGQ